MTPHTLELLEFGRVTAWIASLAASETAAARLLASRPLAAAAERGLGNLRLGEALRREREPGAWCHAPESALGPRLAAAATEPLDGPGLRAVLEWLEAARTTRGEWDAAARERHPALGAVVDAIPDLEPLRERLARSIEPDGRVSDAASPALRRARADLAAGERELERRLERFAQKHGDNAYVTRHGERFVALVPAAGFARRSAIVHDVSGSGQSLFVEPFDATEPNNRLLELRAAAAAEERRVLRELGAEVAAAAEALAAIEDGLARLDALRAAARWAEEVEAVAIEPGGERLHLVAARHPLLHRARGGAVVPLDLTLAGERRLLLVSGPNMGGKTVLLKTVGLCALLAHAALPVPAAEGSAIPELDVVLADLGDHQSVDQGLSTFAAHLAALGAMAEAASPRALVLADELGAGTDPDEGAALARALLERFAERRAWGVVTTHLGSLKRAAGEIAGLASGSLEFDAEALASRFRFIAGVPGASHALAVAGRLGFPAAVVARARALAPESARAIERLITELHQVRAGLEAEREALAAARAAAAAAEETARVMAEEARRTLGAARRTLTRESEALLGQARELWQTVQREAKRAERSRETAESMRVRIADAEAGVARVREAADAAYAAVGGETRPRGVEQVEPGQTVRIEDLGVEAVVASPPDAEGRVQLKRGAWSIQSHVSRLVPVEAPAAPPRAPRGAAATWEAPDAAAALEVDLRGQEADEAMLALDRALDRAVLNGIGELRIIHGVGRGVLRAAVERHLRDHPQVASTRLGQVGEGGRGVTLARLR